MISHHRKFRALQSIRATTALSALVSNFHTKLYRVGSELPLRTEFTCPGLFPSCHLRKNLVALVLEHHLNTTNPAEKVNGHGGKMSTSKMLSKSWRAFVLRSVRRGLLSLYVAIVFRLIIHFRTALRNIKDVDLFQVDLKGDDQSTSSIPVKKNSFRAPLKKHLLQVRKSFRYSNSKLTSAKILAQRSAVPAVISRLSAAKKPKPILTREDKERLFRIAKRLRKGPLNSVMDPTEYAPGSSVFGLSEAVQKSGTYDPWAPITPEENLKGGFETVRASKIKVFDSSFPYVIMVLYFC